MREATQGCVLAGGRAARMGGEKALRPLAGRPLIAHVLARLAPQCGAVAISAGAKAERLAPFGLPVWADALPGEAGPLAGVAAALARAPRPWVVTAPCDMPWLPEDLVARLHAARAAAGASIACASAAGGALEPLVALWPAALAPVMAAALAEGERSARRFLAAQGFIAVEWPASALADLDTPAALAAAEARLSADR